MSIQTLQTAKVSQSQMSQIRPKFLQSRTRLFLVQLSQINFFLKNSALKHSLNFATPNGLKIARVKLRREYH